MFESLLLRIRAEELRRIYQLKHFLTLAHPLCTQNLPAAAANIRIPITFYRPLS